MNTAFPPPLYKYLERQYVSGMLEQGIIRVGTLQDYRGIEQNEQRSDPGEGTQVRYAAPPRFTIREPGQALDPEQEIVANSFGLRHGYRITFENNVVENHESIPDLWLYCTTDGYDPGVMQEFGCDACVRISNPVAFSRTVTRALGDEVGEAGMGQCVYRERVQWYRVADDVPTWRLKPLRYRAQKEVRMAWLPRKLPIQPRIIRCPELALFCCEHKPGDSPAPGEGFLFRDRVFEDLTLEIDNLSFRGCVFRRCHLLYAGGPFHVENCVLENTSSSLAGAALGTLEFLRLVSGGDLEGLRPLLEEFFASGAPPDRHGREHRHGEDGLS